MSYTIYGTQKLLTRLQCPVLEGGSAATTTLGDWYATVIFGRPQIALFVNELTRLSVVMDFAPSATLSERFPAALGAVLGELGVDEDFIARETTSMGAVSFARTRNRSVTGQMTNFVRAIEFGRNHRAGNSNVQLATLLADHPVGVSGPDGFFPSDRVRLLAVDPAAGDAWRNETRAARATKAAVPDTDVARVRRYCAQSSPAELRDQLRMTYHVKGRVITILEQRPPWRELAGDTEGTSLPVAQLRWNPESSTWSLFWCDAEDQWHRCRWIKKGSMQESLVAVETNAYGVFLG